MSGRKVILTTNKCKGLHERFTGSCNKVFGQVGK